jgi:simple sugar transport system ATP-binding protein
MKKCFWSTVPQKAVGEHYLECTTEIRAQIMAMRNQGAAVLLVSEDLDELLALADRILVMSNGQIVYETPVQMADVAIIGHHLAAH